MGGTVMPAACETCEKSMCRTVETGPGEITDFYKACLENEEKIKDGNAKGAPKKEVCAEILACIRKDEVRRPDRHRPRHPALLLRHRQRRSTA